MFIITAHVYVTHSAGKCVGMDCEMVGTGPDASFSMLARCSLVNHHGNVLYDSFVAPMDTITDYRTSVSGVTPSDLRGGGRVCVCVCVCVWVCVCR